MDTLDYAGAVEAIKKINAEKTVVAKTTAVKTEEATKSWYVPGGIFPDQETADYWQAESKNPGCRKRMLAAAGVKVE